MANTTTRTQRRRQTRDNAAEDGGGMAAAPGSGHAPTVDDEADVETVELAGIIDPDEATDDSEAISAANDGAEVEVDMNLDGPVHLAAATDDIFVNDDEDQPEPVLTVIRLNLGRRYGTRTAKLAHRPGCPGHPHRVESFPAETPQGSKLVITRCVDCAEQTYNRLTTRRA